MDELRYNQYVVGASIAPGKEPWVTWQMMTPHQVNDWQARGKREMHELAVLAFAALEGGELDELSDSLQSRIFGRPTQDLLDVQLIDGVWQWRFKPMVELLLRHIADTAGQTGVPAADRHAEIMQAVEMVGF
jgi:hypothetical protein